MPTVRAHTKALTSVHTLRHEHANALSRSLHTWAPIDLQLPKQTASGNQKKKKKDIDRIWPDKQGSVWVIQHTRTHADANIRTYTLWTLSACIWGFIFEARRGFQILCLLNTTLLLSATVTCRCLVQWSRKTSVSIMGTTMFSAEMCGEELEEIIIWNVTCATEQRLEKEDVAARANTPTSIQSAVTCRGVSCKFKSSHKSLRSTTPSRVTSLSEQVSHHVSSTWGQVQVKSQILDPKSKSEVYMSQSQIKSEVLEVKSQIYQSKSQI